MHADEQIALHDTTPAALPELAAEPLDAEPLDAAGRCAP